MGAWSIQRLFHFWRPAPRLNSAPIAVIKVPSNEPPPPPPQKIGHKKASTHHTEKKSLDSLSINVRWRRLQKRDLKMNVCCLKLYCPYSI